METDTANHTRAVTLTEAANELGISTYLVRQLIDSGHLNRLPGIERVYITRGSIDEYVAIANGGAA